MDLALRPDIKRNLRVPHTVCHQEPIGIEVLSLNINSHFYIQGLWLLPFKSFCYFIILCPSQDFKKKNFFLGFWMSVEAQVSDAARDEGLKSALLNVARMWVLSINDQQHCDSLNSLRSEHHQALLRCLSPPFPQSFELDWAPPLSCTCYLCITDLRLWLRRSSIQRPCHEYQPFSIINDIPLTLSPHACEIVCFLCTCCITSFPYNSLQAVDATEQLVLKSVCW